MFFMYFFLAQSITFFLSYLLKNEPNIMLKARDNFTNLFDSHFETIIIVEKKCK